MLICYILSIISMTSMEETHHGLKFYIDMLICYILSIIVMMSMKETHHGLLETER
jgi:hypothetical protein